MTMKSIFCVAIYCLVIVFSLSCSGNRAGTPPTPLDTARTETEPGEDFAQCDIAEFSRSTFDETSRTEKLAVTYSINLKNNVDDLSVAAYIIPHPSVREFELDIDGYENFEIGRLDVDENIQQAKIDFAYHWDEKELVTKMTSKSTTRQERVLLGGEYDKPSLLIVGDAKEYVSPNEFPPRRTWCIAEIPLQKF